MLKLSAALGLLGFAALSSAGYYTLTSSNIDFHNSASPWLGHVTNSTPWLSGKTFSLALDVDPITPYFSQPAINGDASAWVDVYMLVQWHPSFPGDTPPTGNNAGFWSITQSAQANIAGRIGTPGPASVDITGLFANDPNMYNFSQNFISTTLLNYPASTVNNVPLGTFSYFGLGGNLYGEGLFRINLAVAGLGSVPFPDRGGVSASLFEEALLTHIGSEPVL